MMNEQYVSVQVVRSDTDCEGTSESEIQKENMVQTAKKKKERTPRPDVTVEDQYSDQDEVRVQNTNLTGTGTVEHLLQITVDRETVVSNYNNSAGIW